MSGKYSAIQVYPKGSFDNISLQELEIPELQHDQVLIKMECSTINPSDILFIHGYYPGGEGTKGAGLEGSGTVIKSGGGEWADSWLNKRVGVMSFGIWSEYFVASKTTRLFPLLDSITFEQGSSLVVNPMTVLVFYEELKKRGAKGFIQNAAASALGKIFVKWANRNGIPHINLVRRQEQVDILRALGAEHVFNTSEEGWKERAKAVARTIEASVAFDAIGGTATNDLAELILDQGVVFNYGLLSGQSCQMGAAALIFQRKKLQGLGLGSWLNSASQEEFEKVARDIQENIDIFANEFHRETNLVHFKEALASYAANATNNKVLVRLTTN